MNDGQFQSVDNFFSVLILIMYALLEEQSQLPSQYIQDNILYRIIIERNWFQSFYVIST